MAQIRYHDYYAQATTEHLNEHFDQVQRKCKVSGMEVTVAGTWQVQIGPGVWFVDGVAIKETTAVSPLLNISPASSQPRWDVVYGQYTYQPVSPPPVATYGVKQGTPALNPTIPALEENQVALAYIYIPNTATSLNDCTIYQALSLKDQMALLLTYKYEGNIFIRSSDPVEDGEWVRDGDLWLNRDTYTLLTWDAENQRWVPPTIPPHAPTHYANGSDALDVGQLSDVNGYLHPRTKQYHDSLHLDHASLSNVQPDQHHPRDHATTHLAGGRDALPWGHGGGLDADTLDGYHASQFAPANHTHEYNYAPLPHGNESHYPAFSPEGHQHPLSDITGTISIGFVGPTQLTTEKIPTGSTPFWERKLPNLAIPGTAVKITSIQARVATPPSNNITFTFYVDSTSIGQVTIPSGQTSAETTLVPPVTITGTPVLRIQGPSSDAGAKGLDAKFVIVRTQASA